MTAWTSQWEQARLATQQQLLASRLDGGAWEGELSSSALSTAVAVGALAGLDAHGHAEHIRAGLAWLADHQNRDGGWGDTVKSRSNLSTTTLVYCALRYASDIDDVAAVTERCESWLHEQVGSLQPEALAKALAGRYGEDRTFSAPILAYCALSGRLGPAAQAWPLVPSLPFEAAMLPHSLLKLLQVPVVSYALPALIAVGQVRHHHKPCGCPIKRGVRDALRSATLRKLERIQPAGGGFLEAAPLTGFVAMCLAAIGQADCPVARRAEKFLLLTVRPDGSWPIDTNLSTWVTTLSIHALAYDDDLLSAGDRDALRETLVARQYRRTHPYTQAEPGGWAWTDLPGGVPDADDTPGALLALHALAAGAPDTETLAAVYRGVRWLVRLQNRDGGWPTFCRGWGKLPFDRSCPDLTAHVLAALATWRHWLPQTPGKRTDRAFRKGWSYLLREQHSDGRWLPLWFGHEDAPDQANPTYGTARVLVGLHAARSVVGEHSTAMRSAVQWLLRAQHDSGGWGGDQGIQPSVEETGLALEALSLWAENDANVDDAIRRGLDWLVEATRGGTEFPTVPIGLYFAKLWYDEQIYPMVFALAGLNATRRHFSARFEAALPETLG